MAKSPSFSCTACGNVTTKWAGRCEACGTWNTIQEDAGISKGPAKSLGGKRGSAIHLTDLSTEETPPPRTTSGITELDRVLGGGLVLAAGILIGNG